MQFHPNGRWVYFVNEQGQSVSWCDYDANAGTLNVGAPADLFAIDGDPLSDVKALRQVRAVFRDGERVV